MHLNLMLRILKQNEKPDNIVKRKNRITNYKSRAAPNTERFKKKQSVGKEQSLISALRHTPFST